jgi:hypothetical protein
MNVPPGAPSGMHFPYQFIEFVISNLAEGSGSTIIIRLPAGNSAETYYKYGPTPDNPISHWYEFMFDGQTGAEISGDTVILHLADGLRGDDDLTANGQIFDQGGPATTSSGLPVTGQTASYGVGDDGNIQAGVEWPAPRFTDNGDGTVTDNLTGLMWLKDGGCLKKNWSGALTTLADLSGNPTKYKCSEYTGGHSDWRLPNVKEMESLINLGVSNSGSWLNANGFKNIKAYSYWASTSYAGSAKSYAWLVNLSSGTTAYSSKYGSNYILPVRSGTSGKSIDLPKTGQTASYAMGDDGNIQAGVEWPAPRFTENGDGTVTDNLTGLMWLKDGGCFRKNWSSALTIIQDFNANPGKYPCLDYASEYSDWRLPNAKELESLVHYGISNSASWINTNGFRNMKSSSYWSSTTYGGSKWYAWYVDMKAGMSKYTSKYSTYYVLPVRGGNVGGN